MEKVQYADGLTLFAPKEGSPDWNLAKMSFNKERLLEWLKNQPTNDKGYINFDINKSGNKIYAKLNLFGVNAQVESRFIEDEVESIPF
jgi:hypothetical protein